MKLCTQKYYVEPVAIIQLIKSSTTKMSVFYGVYEMKCFIVPTPCTVIHASSNTPCALHTAAQFPSAAGASEEYF